MTPQGLIQFSDLQSSSRATESIIQLFPQASTMLLVTTTLTLICKNQWNSPLRKYWTDAAELRQSLISCLWHVTHCLNSSVVYKNGRTANTFHRGTAWKWLRSVKIFVTLNSSLSYIMEILTTFHWPWGVNDGSTKTPTNTADTVQLLMKMMNMINSLINLFC